MKNLNPDTAEQLAKQLEACAQESAKLDEKMLRIRNRISEDGTAVLIKDISVLTQHL